MMKGGLGNLMKQAQKMQENMTRTQEELASIEIEGQAGNGLVKVVMTCGNKVRRVKIDPSLPPHHKDILEDLFSLHISNFKIPKTSSGVFSSTSSCGIGSTASAL